MFEEFVDTIESLRRRLEQRILLRAIGWSLTCLLLTAGLWALSDYFFRWQERGMRLLGTGIVLAVVVFCWVRFLWPALRMRIPGIALAAWLEHSQQRPHGSLAAAWEFLAHTADDQRLGSPGFKQLAVTQGLAGWEPPPWPVVASASPGLLPVVLAGAIVGSVLLAGLFYPVVLGTALLRLLNPFADVSFPQRTHLVVLDYPERLSRGGTFSLVVGEEQENLPRDAWIAIRGDEAGPNDDLVRPLQLTGDHLVYRQENVRESFEFRVFGGDDRGQPWRRVEVVDPPQVRELRIELTPPTYTGWPKEEARDAIHAIAGTQVALYGRANRPLRKVKVLREPGGAGEAEILSDGVSFRFPPAAPTAKTPGDSGWILDQSGHYALLLDAADGTFSVNEPRWEIRVFPDHPPTGVLEAGQRLLTMTPQGKFPLRLVAKDDLLLRRVELLWAERDVPETAPAATPIYQAPSNPQPRGKMSEHGSSAHTVEQDWLFQLPAEMRGRRSRLRLVLRAEDYKGQVSDSSPVECDVVTPEEFEQRLAAEQERLIDELAEVQRTFQNLHVEWQKLAAEMADKKNLSRPLAHQLFSLELSQRQIFRRVSDGQNGLVERVQDLVQTAGNNGLVDAKVRQLEKLRAALLDGYQTHALVAETDLSAITAWARGLVERAASEAAEFSIASDWSAIQRQFRSVTQHQQAFLEVLTSVLNDAGGIRLLNRLRRQLEEVLAQQQTLIVQTMRFGRQTLGRSLQELTAEEQQALARVSKDQAELGRKVEEILAEVQRQIDRSRDGAQTSPSMGSGLSSPPALVAASSPNFQAASDNQGGDAINEGQPDQTDTTEGLAQDATTISETGQPATSDRAGQPAALADGTANSPSPSNVVVFRKVLDRATEGRLTALMREAASTVQENRLGEAVAIQQSCETLIKELLSLLSGEVSTLNPEEAKKLEEVERLLTELSDLQSHLVEQLKQGTADPASVNKTLQDFSQRQREAEALAQSLAKQLDQARQPQVRDLIEGARSAMEAARSAADQGQVNESMQQAAAARDLLNQSLLAWQAEQKLREFQRTAERLQQLAESMVQLAAEQQDIIRRTQALDLERKRRPQVETEPAWRSAVQKLAVRQQSLNRDLTEAIRRFQEGVVFAALLDRLQQTAQQAADRLSNLQTDEQTQQLERNALRMLQVLASIVQMETSPPEENAAAQSGDQTSEQPQASPQQVFLAAQLRVLRGFQAAINDRTRQLEQDKDRPDLDRELAQLSRDQSLVLDLLLQLREELARTPPLGEEPVATPQEQGTLPPAPERPPQPGSIQDLLVPPQPPPSGEERKP